MFFCAVGAILNIIHGEDVLHLRSKNDYYIFFYQHFTPTGYFISMWVGCSWSQREELLNNSKNLSEKIFKNYFKKSITFRKTAAYNYVVNK